MTISYANRLKGPPKADVAKVSKAEAEDIFAGKNTGEHSVESDVLNSVLDVRYQKQIDHLLDMRKQDDQMKLKERQSAVNASKAVTGVLGIWCLIGVVMLGKSCINMDPGPKFKV